ncbi:uncharacterized protein LOC131859155 [Cryptomeria japonica]|uniref:uncharacterized protein LOC131859155 n=1 Tax=Cryptomeria japonica TaxID=3369 RepID=UPI0027DAAB22|nr:uncharacterized protein LOC131859155 [Cryptomeria japonica]
MCNSIKETPCRSDFKVRPAGKTTKSKEPKKRKTKDEKKRRLTDKVNQPFSEDVAYETNQFHSSCLTILAALKSRTTNVYASLDKNDKKDKIYSSKWSFPLTGWIKVNFYGAAKGNPGPTGCGGVIRNEAGDYIAVMTLPIGSQTNPLAEPMAAYQVITLAKTLGYQNVWLKGDLNNIIRCLKGLSPPSWTIKNIISFSKEIIKSLEWCVISYNHRETNSMADWVANMIVRVDQMISWRGELDLPNDARPILVYDRVYGKDGEISDDNIVLINESCYNESKRVVLEGRAGV